MSNLSQSFQFVMAVEAWKETIERRNERREVITKGETVEPRDVYSRVNDEDNAQKPHVSVKSSIMNDTFLCHLDDEDIEYLYTKHKARLTKHFLKTIK